MNRRPDAPDPLSPEERDLAERLARLGPHDGPSPALDARILAAARAAAAQTAAAPVQRRRRSRWPAWIGVAASLTLAVGVAWQLRPADAPLGAASEADAIVADTAMAPSAAQATGPAAAEPATEPAADAAADAAAPAMPSMAPPAPASEPRAAAELAPPPPPPPAPALAEPARPAAPQSQRKTAPALAPAPPADAQPAPIPPPAPIQAAPVPPAPVEPAPAAAPRPAPAAASPKASDEFRPTAPAANQAPAAARAAAPVPSPTGERARQVDARGSLGASPAAGAREHEQSERAADTTGSYSRQAPAEPRLQQYREPVRGAPTASANMRSAEAAHEAPAAAESSPMLDRVEVTGTRMGPEYDPAIERGLSAVQWLERIRRLRAEGEDERARASLQRFQRAHPKARVPSDLRALIQR